LPAAQKGSTRGEVAWIGDMRPCRLARAAFGEITARKATGAAETHPFGTFEIAFIARLAKLAAALPLMASVERTTIEV
jgi:hypothetical protein